MQTPGRTALAAVAALAAAAATLAAAAPAARVQTAARPSKPVRIVVPYPPCGPTDIVACLVAEVLAEPETWLRSAADGAIAGSGTPSALGTFVGREIDTWRGVVQRANVKVD